MPSPHAAVTKPEYSVEMQAGLAVVSLRYVTEQTQYFALLIDGNRNVPPGGESNHPTLAFSNAPIAVTDAALIACSFANAVIAAKASSPGSRIRTNVRPSCSEASLDFMSRLAVKPDGPSNQSDKRSAGVQVP